MRVLTCSVATTPCPPESQTWVEIDPASPADLGINAEDIALVFSWGVGAVLLLWSLGYGVGVALKVIRSL